MTIELKNHQKMLILGEFESGKSTLVKTILGRFPRTLVFDPVWEYGVGAHDLAGVESQLAQTGRGILQPYNAEADFEPFCKLALRQVNTLVAIDEPTLVMDSRSQIPDAFNRLYRLGHKRGNGVILATHRISGDLPSLLKMNHHFFVFKTVIDLDRETLRDYIGDDAALWIADPPPYHFWHKGPGHNGPVQPVSGVTEQGSVKSKTAERHP
jgi:hypothetical protein